MSVDSLIWSYECDEPIVVASPDGGVRLAIAIALFEDGVSYADDGILDAPITGQPFHHIRGDRIDLDNGFECGDHRFTVMPPDDRNFPYWASALRMMQPNPILYRQSVWERLVEQRNSY